MGHVARTATCRTVTCSYQRADSSSHEELKAAVVEDGETR